MNGIVHTVRCKCLSKATPLDTLEQLDHAPLSSSETALSKRARSKYFSKSLAVALYWHGGKLKRQYGRTLDCSDVIEQDPDGSLKTHYCGYRWCLVCNRIRIAKAINRYKPILSTWSDAHMVTLTVPNVYGADLREMLEAMLKAFTSCKRSIKRKHKLSFKAIRKLEITYNAETDKYHPHYHIAVDGEVQAQALVCLWLDKWPTADGGAQHIRAITDGTLIELFKYFTRVISKGTKTGAHIPSLAIIFEAMEGKRVFQSVGFTLAADSANDPEGVLDVEQKDTAFKRHAERVVWRWRQEHVDWIDLDTGECLTGYAPGERWSKLVSGITPGSEVDQAQSEVLISRMAPFKLE